MLPFSKRILVGIILLGAVLRFYHITFHDSYTDEAILAFRAEGLIDYDASPSQTTPWQWVASVPWWMHLSMHDHPIFYFLLQHISYLLFGANLFAVRLPSVLAGIVSVYLLFLIGKKLFNERTGLLAAGLLAILSYHLWVSRLGLQDGVVIALILLALWVYLLALDDKRYWLLLGAVCGIGVITKYTFLIVFPILLLHAIINRIPLHRNRFVFFGSLVLLFFSSPSWLYNLFLYKTTDHFDFQISAALHENVPQWSFRMGRELAGGLSDRFMNFFRAMRDGNSVVFIAVSAIAFLWSCIDAWRKKDRALAWLIGATMLMYGWFFVIGSTYRFVVMIVPFLALLIGVFFDRVVDLTPRSSPVGRGKLKMCAVLVGVFFVGEFLFSVNTFFLLQPFGKRNIAYAAVNDETQNVGFNQLNTYLEKQLAGKMSAALGTPQYQFLTDLVNRRMEEKKRAGLTPYPLVIVTDHNINFIAGLWYFDRLLIYDGWPVVYDDDFVRITKGRFEDFYRDQGVQHFLYVSAATDRVRRLEQRFDLGGQFKKHLDGRGIVPEIIRDAHGMPAFAVYAL